jgi:SAM-dependent methyltransferase
VISARNAHFLTEAVGAAAAIAAGGRLGVFDALASGPLTAAELAVRCDLAEGPAGRLLSALASIGVLDRERGRYRLAVDRGLVESQRALWCRLPDVVRGGSSAGFDDASIAADAYPSLVGLLRALARNAAPRAAVLLAAGLPDCASVLDVGAGAAAWSLALAALHPSCQVTTFDLPPVLNVTRRAVESAGRTDRYRFLAGDAFSDELGGPYDLALVANVVHLFGEARAVELLTRVAAELRPSGRLALIDVIPDGASPSRRAAVHDLSLLLRTRDGALHSFGSYATWLRRAGLEPMARHRLQPGWEAALVLASRPTG